MYDVVNIIICFNNSNEVLEYISRIQCSSQNNKILFYVVANSYTKEDYNYLSSLNDINVQILYPETNLGYMNGLLYGYKHFLNSKKKSRYVIFSNTDIEISDKFFITLLNNKYAKDIGVIAPSIYVAEIDIFDNPVLLKRRTKFEICKYIFKFSIPIFREIYICLSTIKRKFFVVKHKRPESTFAYEVHGCFVILSSTFASLIADEKFEAFMYCEETYIAELARQYGFKTYYDKSLKIIHFEHQTTNILNAKSIAKYTKESMIYIKRRFY